MSEWADVDHWKATVGAQQNTAFRAFEVTHALRSVGADASEDGTGRGTLHIAATDAHLAKMARSRRR